MEYSLIMEKNDYALVIRGLRKEEYAVVYELNKERGDWGHTCKYWNFSEYSRIGQAEALARAVDYFRMKTEENYITRSRLEEIATLCKDGLIEDDESTAMEYLADTVELTEYECEFFGVDYEDMCTYSQWKI